MTRTHSRGQALLWVLILIVILLAAGWYFWFYEPAGTSVTATSTATSTNTNGQGNTTSDGTITFTRPEDFGLAVTPQQILATSTVPACDPGFEYCLYYNGDTYKGTNFESAGLSINKRADLTAERVCLDTPPTGFVASTTPNDTESVDTYSSSVFTDVGDSGAGHTSQGSLFRLFVRQNPTCYEFETRIAMTRLGNYATGTVQEFTTADRGMMLNKLNAILRNIKIAGETVSFPGL